MQIRLPADLVVYKKAYHLAMEIFRLTETWPPEEKYSLTGQIRRSTRSVCANLREAWSKRRYEPRLLGKLADSDGENSETDTWLDFARDCGCLAPDEHARLSAECRQVGAMLGSMIKNPSPFLVRPPTSDLRPSTPAPSLPMNHDLHPVVSRPVGPVAAVAFHEPSM
jgi:four helix bundle protein